MHVRVSGTSAQFVNHHRFSTPSLGLLEGLGGVGLQLINGPINCDLERLTGNMRDGWMSPIGTFNNAPCSPANAPPLTLHTPAAQPSRGRQACSW